MKAKTYRPNFPAMMRLYETNYAQLCRLIPRTNRVGDEASFQIDLMTYRITIVESTRYTNLVVIQQIEPKVNYWGMPELKVRLYHDALTAEVCASRQICRFKARFDYPEQIVFQPDEKHQINQFLSDWLKNCLKYGTTLVLAC